MERGRRSRRILRGNRNPRLLQRQLNVNEIPGILMEPESTDDEDFSSGSDNNYVPEREARSYYSALRLMKHRHLTMNRSRHPQRSQKHRHVIQSFSGI